MGRGLSSLQKEILKLALSKEDHAFCADDVLIEIYKLEVRKPNYDRNIYGSYGSKRKFENDAWKQRPAVYRSFRRLREKGLLKQILGYHKLTEEGYSVAKNL